jgi:hypothetical protein
MRNWSSDRWVALVLGVVMVSRSASQLILSQGSWWWWYGFGLLLGVVLVVRAIKDW